jgi:predicted lipoprotein with Yx(FWY)xxD motif
MKFVTWISALFCVAAAFPAAAKMENKDYPNVPEEVSMIADDKAPRGFYFQSEYGFPFYATTADGTNKSTCMGPCVETWAPVKAKDKAVPVNKDWALIERPEGYKQWSYKGHPLYINMQQVMGGGDPSLPKDSPWHVFVP